MKAEFQMFIIMFEELDEAGETAVLTLKTKGGKSSIKLQHQVLKPRLQLLVGVAVIVEQEQKPAATSRQLPTKLRCLKSYIFIIRFMNIFIIIFKFVIILI